MDLQDGRGPLPTTVVGLTMRATAASLLRQTLAPAVRATRPTQLRASLRRLDGDHANRDPGIIPYWGLRKSPNIERWAVMRNHMDKHFEFTPIAIKTIIIGCIIFPAWVYYMTVDGVVRHSPPQPSRPLLY